MSQIVEQGGKKPNLPESEMGLQLLQIYQPVSEQLESVEQLLRQQLTTNTPWVAELLSHSRLTGGKRLRPVFLLLSGASVSELSSSHIHVAAGVEMIHTATLIHDDVLDDAQTRRHRPTANSKWGNKTSVLLGDFLFTHGFHVACHCESAPALTMLASASNKVCAGEIRQNNWCGNFDLTEQQYFDLISDKTAELCAVSCKLGALLSGADERLMLQFEDYGRNLGIAFQIIDDVLDLTGHAKEVGKTLHTDLKNRKPTLPIIHCLRTLTPANANEFKNQLNANELNVESIVRTLNLNESIQYARNAAADHAKRAVKFTETLPKNIYSESLNRLAEFVLKRSY